MIPRQARFTREDGAIEVDLAGLAPEQVDHLDISWPSQALRTATLVDTPGIGSLTESVGRRTWELLVADEEETPADAVLYLMRHLHSGDVEFLRAFHDVEVSRPDPVNAIGVLSRADEIGAGRPDSMASARKIAARLTADPVVRRVVQTVVPVAGLLAETAVTLTEAEVARLRAVAALPPNEVAELLLSADRFLTRRPDLGVTETERQQLLDRFGLFGIRLTSTLLRRPGVTATDLARDLAARSGLDELQGVLSSLFHDRRDVLKSRSALLAVDRLVRTDPRPGSDALAVRVEEVLASAHPFQELRVLSAVRAGWVTGRPDVVADLEHLVGGCGTTVHERLRLDPDAAAAQRVQAAQEALARWQRRAENPLTSHELVVAGRVAIRSCEGMLADLARAR